MGIYHLNLFIAFLTPKIDPAMEEYEGNCNFCAVKENESHVTFFFFMLIKMIQVHLCQHEQMKSSDHSFVDYLNLNFGIR